MPLVIPQPGENAQGIALTIWLCLLAMWVAYLVTEIHADYRLRQKDLRIKQLEARLGAKERADGKET